MPQVKPKDPSDFSLHLIRLRVDVSKAESDELIEAARMVNRAANAAARYWVRWHEDHPGQDKPVTNELMREMYGRARAVVPELLAMIVSSACGNLRTLLTKKMPYDHCGMARFGWQAIIAFETSPPTFRRMTIPLHNRDVCVVLDDHGAAAVAKLWCRQSLREAKALRLPIATKGMPIGLRKILRRVAGKLDGFRHADSEIVQKEDRRGRLEWWLHLNYYRPAAPRDAEHTATLWPAPPDAEHLFLLEAPDGGVLRVCPLNPWQAQHQRFKARMHAIQQRYRDGLRKGRGRKRIQRTFGPVRRGMQDLTDRVRKQAAAQVATLADKLNVGRIVYREPELELRSRLGSAVRRLDWDWTAFQQQLQGKLTRCGIVIEGGRKLRVRPREHEQKFAYSIKPKGQDS